MGVARIFFGGGEHFSKKISKNMQKKFKNVVNIFETFSKIFKKIVKNIQQNFKKILKKFP